MNAQTQPPRLIAVTGTIGSGKDTVGEYLAQKFHMHHVSAGDVLREEAHRRGVADPIPREVLAMIGDDLHAETEPGPICRKALEQYSAVADRYPGGLVITGFRRVNEIETVKANSGTVIFVDAPDEIRFQRVSERQRGEDPLTFEEFLASEKAESEGTTPAGKAGTYLNGVKELADIKIENSGSKEDLFEAIKKLFLN